MLAQLFHTGCQTQCFVIPGRDQFRLAFRKRPRFVHHQRVHFLQAFQRLGIADEHTGCRAAARPHHDRHRRGQPQRARTRNDQHRNRIHQRVRQPGLRTDEGPHDERHDRGGNYRRHKHRRHAIRQPLDGCARALRFAHHLYDARQQRFRTDVLGFHDECARTVYGPAGGTASRRFFHWNRLARDHRLINGTRPLRHHAVHRNAFARPHAQQIARMHAIERHVFLGSVGTNPPSGVGRQLEQSLDRAAGLAARAQFQHLSQQHQADDHSRRFKVQRELAAMPQ